MKILNETMKTFHLALIVLMTGLLCVGNAVGQDEKKTESNAARIFEETLVQAKDRDVSTMGLLGFMYANGEGVIQDFREASKWYRKAAELGDTRAMGLLGIKYKNGDGVIQDDVEAYAWSNVAAANGGKEAAELRDAIKTNMTSEQIGEGHKRSREIMKSISKNNPLADTDIISTN